MVACELTRSRRLKALVLFGSATSPSEIDPRSDLIHHSTEIASMKSFQTSAHCILTELSERFGNAGIEFIRAMGSVILRWEGLDVPPCFRIDGWIDSVIHIPANTDLLVNGGSVVYSSRST